MGFFYEAVGNKIIVFKISEVQQSPTTDMMDVRITVVLVCLTSEKNYFNFRKNGRKRKSIARFSSERSQILTLSMVILTDVTSPSFSDGSLSNL